VEFINQARDDLRRNPGPALAWLVLVFCFSLFYTGADHFVTGDLPQTDPPHWAAVYRLVMAIVFAAVISAGEAVFFARLGREIDKPLWKCPSDYDALRRFFAPWFILNLLGVTLQHLEGNAAASGNEALYSLLSLIYMALFLLTIPIGACVMYHGALNWEEFGEIIKPIYRQPRPVLIALMILLAEYMLYLMMLLLISRYAALRIAAPGFDMLLAGFDVFAFAVMWRVCMLHRDTRYYDESDPFDF
jgi:hypothetical protein